mmetsp:Transcript_13829/g.32693  ORF Transcript_13829/g.32693 Transcript_13829/m.32693 type:complete len:235 (-) Transcript_13829:697-1401(-)
MSDLAGFGVGDDNVDDEVKQLPECRGVRETLTDRLCDRRRLEGECVEGNGDSFVLVHQQRHTRPNVVTEAVDKPRGGVGIRRLHGGAEEVETRNVLALPLMVENGEATVLLRGGGARLVENGGVDVGEARATDNLVADKVELYALLGAHGDAILERLGGVAAAERRGRRSDSASGSIGNLAGANRLPVLDTVVRLESHHIQKVVVHSPQVADKVGIPSELDRGTVEDDEVASRS